MLGKFRHHLAPVHEFLCRFDELRAPAVVCRAIGFEVLLAASTSILLRPHGKEQTPCTKASASMHRCRMPSGLLDVLLLPFTQVQQARMTEMRAPAND